MDLKHVTLVAMLGIALLAAACQAPKAAPPKNNLHEEGMAASVGPLNKPPSEAWAPAKGGEVWRSVTTHKDYRVKIDGDKLYADWVDISPVASKYHAYIHTECVRKGSKWVGTSKIFMPCTEGSGAQEHIANTCHLTVKFEIDSISRRLITGHTEGLKPGGFVCQSCKVLATLWAAFKWVPVSQMAGAQATKAKTN